MVWVWVSTIMIAINIVLIVITIILTLNIIFAIIAFIVFGIAIYCVLVVRSYALTVSGGSRSRGLEALTCIGKVGGDL